MPASWPKGKGENSRDGASESSQARTGDEDGPEPEAPAEPGLVQMAPWLGFPFQQQLPFLPCEDSKEAG